MTALEASSLCSPESLNGYLAFIAKMQRLATTPAVSPFKHGFGFYPAFATKSSGLLNTKNRVVNSNQFLNTCLQVLSLSFPLGQLVQTQAGQGHDSLTTGIPECEGRLCNLQPYIY